MSNARSHLTNPFGVFGAAPARSLTALTLLALLIAAVLTLPSLLSPPAAQAAAGDATGAPTISGTAQAGSVLTSSTSGIGDTDGLTSVAYSYQWVRVDSTDTDITGATAASYYPSDADVGKTLKLRVSFTDDASNAESLTSAETAAVTAHGTRNVVLSGTMTVASSSDGVGFIQALSQGSLSPAAFTVDSTTYTISTLVYGTSNKIRLILDTAPPGDFTLLYGTSGQVESSAADTSTTGYAWATANPGWSTGDKVPFALALDTNRPATGAPVIDTGTPGDQLWTATMGVGDNQTGLGYYFAPIVGGGSLSPDNFMSGGETYTVRGLWDDGAGSLVLLLDKGIPHAFVLTAGGVAFSSADATRSVTGASRPYLWDVGAISWSENDMVPITLHGVGPPQVGTALTASVSGIGDPEGVNDAVFTYQWVSVVNGVDTDIANAEAPAYYPHRRRRGQDLQGEGQLHRRRGLRRGAADQRGDRGGGGLGPDRPDPSAGRHHLVHHADRRSVR